MGRRNGSHRFCDGADRSLSQTVTHRHTQTHTDTHSRLLVTADTRLSPWLPRRRQVSAGIVHPLLLLLLLLLLISTEHLVPVHERHVRGGRSDVSGAIQSLCTTDVRTRLVERFSLCVRAPWGGGRRPLPIACKTNALQHRIAHPSDELPGNGAYGTSSLPSSALCSSAT